MVGGQDYVGVASAQDGRLMVRALVLDRQERGKGELSAIQEVNKDYGIDVHSIITMTDLIDYLSMDDSLAEHLAAMRAYREQYGIS